MIPDRFQIYGRTIEVEWRELIHDEQETNGFCVYDQNKIILRIGIENDEHVFYHELTHMILDAMKSDKSEDESFVEVFSGLLHQALSTSETDSQPYEIPSYGVTTNVYDWTDTNGDGKAVTDNGAVG